MKNQQLYLKLTLRQKVTHYMIVIYFLFILITISSLKIYNLIFDSEPMRVSNDDLLSILLASVSFSILFYLIQKYRLRYKEVLIHFTEDQFQEAIRRTELEFNWKIQKNSHSFFRALVPTNGFGEWYLMLSIKKYKDRILINSICDPTSKANAFSYRANFRIINTFLSHLNETTQNLPEKSTFKEEIKSNEWGIKRTIIRIIAYPFCIILLALGFYVLINPINIRSIPTGIGVIIIAGTYLHIDMKILIKNRRLKNNISDSINDRNNS